MSDVFAGTYADWRLVRTRGVVQVVLEVPLDKADAAYQVLGGMPDSGKEVWFAVARLKPNGKTAPSPIPHPKRLVQQAGIYCADPVFQRFLMEKGLAMDHSEAAAADAVREACGVHSRSEIIVGSIPADKWERLAAQYELWKRA